MDVVVLVVYQVWGASAAAAEPHPFYPLLLAAKALVNLLLYLWYGVATPRYNERNPLKRWANVFYALQFGLFEFLLFVLGPQGVGSFARLLAVPFIMGAITILQRGRMAVLGGLYYLALTLYLPSHISASFSFFSAPVFLVNIWLVAWLCACLVSSIIYTGYAKNFLHSARDQVVQKELELLASRDQVTGISNRLDFERFMEATWEDERARGEMTAFLMLDIDHFRKFNERFGHAAGDKLLVRVTKSVEACLSGLRHLLVRYRGEEFLLVVFGVAPDEAAALGESVRVNVESMRIENPDSAVGPYVTVSLGVACVQADRVHGYAQMVALADECLYFATSNGRNRVIYLDNTTYQYMDIDGKAQRHLAPSPGEDTGFDPDYLNGVIKEANLDCTFAYVRQHKLLEFSPFAREMLGMPGFIADVTLDKVFDMLPFVADSVPAVRQRLEAAIRSRQRQFEAEARLAGEDRRWVAIRARLLYGADGRLAVITGTLLAIQNVMDYSSYTYEQAMVSAISHLPNRKRFYRDAEGLLAAGGASGHMLLFDIRDFKSVNSIFSHSIGDKTLRKVGSLLQNLADREADVYHYAVDQFILIIKRTQHAGIREMADRILQFFTAYDLSIEGMPMRITFNVGAVAFGPEDHHVDDLLVNLDIALQKSKTEGRTNICFFSGEDRSGYMVRLNLEKELAEAVASGYRGFRLFYQPLFTASCDRCVGAEALLRYTSKDGEIISPMVVVALLEKQGLIEQTGLWILRQASRQCARREKRGAGEDFVVHVNLSPRQLEDPAFVAEVLDVLEATGLAPGNLVLEVTENSLVSDSGRAVANLRQLRNLGVRSSVDDFGTGYSALSYLNRLPADQIKLDRSFLEGIETDEASRSMLCGLIDFVSSMGYQVCVEGVETEEHYNLLRGTPADLLQGYLLGRPVSPEDFRWAETSWLTGASSQTM